MIELYHKNIDISIFCANTYNIYNEIKIAYTKSLSIYKHINNTKNNKIHLTNTSFSRDLLTLSKVRCIITVCDLYYHTKIKYSEDAMFPNISKRKTATIQVWVSLTLILLALIMSFMPIIKVNTENLKNTVEKFIDNDNVDLDDIDWDVLPKEVEFTAPNLIQSSIFFADIISFTSENHDADALAEYVKEKVEEETSKDALASAFAILSIFSDSANPEMNTSNPLPMIFSITVSFFAFLYIILTILIIPIILIINAIIALAYAIANTKSPEKATPKVSSRLTGLLSVLFMILLFQCALPQVSFAWGAILLLIITAVSIIMNSVAIRLPAYRKEDMMYANIVQGTSLIGILGFLIFFFSLIKTGILTSFINGPFFSFVQEFDAIENLYASDYLIDAILMLFYILFIFITIDYISKVTRRLSLSCKKESRLIVLPILALPVFIIPTIIKTKQNLNIVDNGEVLFETSSLYLTDSGETALIFVLIGIIIMILAEIAYLVVPKILCKNMTSDEKLLVITGKMPEFDPSTTQDAPKNTQDSKSETAQESEQEATHESN